MDGETVKVKNQQGLGIVQVMVALAATAGLTYSILHNASVSNKQMAKASFDQQFESQVNEVQAELAKLENCTATLRGKTISAIPVAVPSVKRGTLNTTTTPPSVVVGPDIFSTLKPNSQGVYISSIHFLTRTERDPMDVTRTITNDVIRVQFQSGDISATGVVRPRANALGASNMAKDFIIQSDKNAAGVISTCFSDSANLVENSCQNLAETVWNEQTKKCEFPNAIPKGDLVQLWITKTGALAYNKPADAENGEVTCQKSNKRCSRTSLDCALPACPANHYKGPAWEWDRKQSTWDKACMKSAKCMYVPQRAGWVVKP